MKCINNRYCGRIIFLILLISSWSSSAIKASDPIVVLVSLKPPYSPFFNDYASLGSSNLQVTFIVKDSRMMNQAGKIQFFVEHIGTGIVMRTSENTSIPPVFFNGNVSEALTGADLASYFKAENLVFSGIDESQFVSTGRIPDGQYRIGFKVVDARRPEVEYSQIGFSQPAWFVLNDPPMLNLPENNINEKITIPQNVKLQWFPRHLGSMNSSFSAVYQLELFAMRIPGMEPNQIALSMQPDFTDEVMNTRYIISPEKYMLEPGVEYAWRVKATHPEGLYLFHNGGNSEVYTFTYGNSCPVPTAIETQVKSSEKVVISWVADPAQTSFQIRYRVKGQKDAVWHLAQSNSNQIELEKLLTPGYEYEYQVQGICSESPSEYSSMGSFGTPVINPEPFECGKIDSSKIIGQKPLESLESDQFIYSGNFPIKIIEVSGENGIFTGQGMMQVPFLSNIYINIKFENIMVNTEYQIYSGEVVSVSKD